MVTVREHLEEMKTHFKELSDGYDRFSPQHEYYKGVAVAHNTLLGSLSENVLKMPMWEEEHESNTAGN